MAFSIFALRWHYCEPDQSASDSRSAHRLVVGPRKGNCARAGFGAAAWSSGEFGQSRRSPPGLDDPHSRRHIRGVVLPSEDAEEFRGQAGRFTRERLYGATTVVDGGWLLPGLVDAHTHPGSEQPGDRSMRRYCAGTARSACGPA